MATGVELATAWVRLVPSADGIQGDLTKELEPAAEKAGDSAGKKAGSKFSAGMKAALAVGAAAAVAGVVKVFQVGMEELKFGEQINAQTDQLIANTGFAMKTSEINDFTLALSKVSGVSEEELQKAGNNIIKFGGVSEENYKRAVESINDLAATGKDASGVSEALGKALADPAKAAGLLKRQGVILNEEQKALIANMTEAGDKAGAQGVILDALEGTYGGMAETAGGTLEGNINKLNNAFENLAGDVVSTLMPAITGIVTGLQGLVDWMAQNPELVMVLAVALGVLALAFVGVTVATWAMNTALLANPITWIILAIVALIAAIVLLIMNWDKVVAWFQDVWAAVCAWFEQTLNDISSWWTGIWTEVGNFFRDLWAGIVSFFTGLWNGIQAWWQGLILGIAIFVLNTIANIKRGWETTWNAVVNFFKGLWNGVTTFVDGVFKGIGNAINTALNWIKGIWNSMWSGMVSFFGNIFGGIVGIAKAPINGVISLINGAIRALNGFKVTIPDWVPGIGGQTWGLSIPTIPMLATGGSITRSGYAIVGENGPELLKLPRGAQVNPDYDELPEGGGVTFNNYAPVGQEPTKALRQFANRRGF